MQDKIKHITWGDGTVIEMNGKYIRVCFDDAEVGTKLFIYPDAFEKHMKYYDSQLQSDAEDIIRRRRENDETARRLEQQKKQQAMLLERIKRLEQRSRQKRKTKI